MSPATIVDGAICGLGYVPVRSPPAVAPAKFACWARRFHDGVDEGFCPVFARTATYEDPPKLTASSIAYASAGSHAPCHTRPFGPVAPVDPVAPVAPVGPCGPWEPIAPVFPVAPVGPIGPWEPVAPVVPAGPRG